ncbi:50S ribosomal protein L3 [bacterium (Candidatus Torokbacteria) CG_4_10_14_0_2_um_filter_35_8]|nr:MAG: 50S ribosomal protein L3 [bacterium (Candidatus Torokbacteria) CG_4_10_14_0_2_um_filter_35_8]
MKCFITRKKGMTQFFSKEGKVIPATLVWADFNEICAITPFLDYTRVELGFLPIKNKIRNNENHSKDKKSDFRFKRSFKVASNNKVSKKEDRAVEEVEINGKKVKVKDKITVDLFRKWDKVKVVGISKGKGFQGVMKRHGFQGGPASHGASGHRKPGSIGSGYPQRVVKGRQLPGRMGHNRITVKGLKVLKIDKEKGLMLVQGAIPGTRDSIVKIISE